MLDRLAVQIRPGYVSKQQYKYFVLMNGLHKLRKKQQYKRDLNSTDYREILIDSERP